jgi:Bifunctional PLP-dependent enzyme with beta-cystathionase and maltose regulon repressor activities
MYDFDKVVDRHNTNSVKWDMLEDLYGRSDLIPLWVADMDFEAPHAIVEALTKRVNHHVLGYTFPSDEYYNAVIGWMKRRHNWNIEKEWITYTPGVVPALSYAIRAFTKPGDKVIIQTPVYHPFYAAIEENGRELVRNPLIYRDGKYYMDYEDLERKIDKDTTLLVLCSPHNPVGRVWTKDELNHLGDICLKHNILIVSDEIHFDIVYKGNEHTVFGSISPEISENCAVLTAPSKTFNIAGLQVSNVIISNEELREKFRKELEKDHISSPNIFGAEALIAAYNEAEDWVDELLEYLEGNRDFFIEYVNSRIPKLKVLKPEGTYLMWVDCSGLNMNPEELRDFFVNKCRVALNDGEMFGEEGKLYQRFNIGCPRSQLKEALNRIERAINMV